MRKSKTTLKLTAVSTLVAVSFLLATALPAHAYGNTAQWQIGFSFNCNDPKICGPVPPGSPPGTTTPGTNGFWGWCEFGANGNDGDCQVTGYARTSLGIATAPNHQHVEVTGWTVAPGMAGPATFIITAGSVTNRGPGTPFPLTFPFDTGIPAAPGHYNFATIFGMPAPPGIHFNIQVNQLNH